MKAQGIVFLGLGLAVFTSCSSVRKLSDKDSRVTTTMTKKPRNIAPREFLDMEVTPGGKVQNASGSITLNKHSKRSSTASKPSVTYDDASLALRTGSSDIEKANMLQLKYAVAMDASVELLTNLALLQVIDKWWGVKYCLGGNSDSCIDCSRFTQTVLHDVYRQDLPRTAQDQFNACDKVELEDLREGDLVFFNTGGGRDISHVGVYLLNNKFVHASTSAGVMISDLNDTYWQPKYRGAGRISAGREATATNH
jgi:lipoprotein Spr